MSRNDQYQYMLSIAALVMSALAMIFAFMELRSSDRQFEANVWPYVDLDLTVNADSFEISATNKGMGPALVHEFRILLDGISVDVPSVLLEHADYVPADEMSFYSSSVASSVLSAGETITALRIAGEGSGTALSSLMPELAIEICYCAVNGTCWNNPQGDPFRTEVEQCRSQSDDLDRRLDMFNTDAEDPQ